MKQNIGKKIFSVIQTDARQTAAGKALEKKGYTIVGAAEIAIADYILLPLPLDDTRLQLAQLLRVAKKEAIAFGGKISEAVKIEAEKSGIVLLDYFEREELAILNAIPTAEGCISLLLTEQEVTIWGEEILIIGFGRLGQALAIRLNAMGARVTVAAKKACQRALALSMGCSKAIDIKTLAHACQKVDTVINTAPCMVLPAQILEKMPKQSLIIDLASKPGGIDFTAAEQLGHTAIHALGLPSKSAPNSAGAFVAATVLEMIAERGNL